MILYLLKEYFKYIDENAGDALYEIAGGKGSELGTGGMITKLNAAKLCMDNGIDMIITNGSKPLCLYDIFDGKQIGTRFTVK